MRADKYPPSFISIRKNYPYKQQILKKREKQHWIYAKIIKK